jgi:oligoendopeptidase F
MSTVAVSPNWDLSVYFPGLDSPEFGGALTQAYSDVDSLQRLFDAHKISAREVTEPAEDQVATFEEVVDAYGSLQDRLRLLGSYIHGFVTTDSTNTLAQSRLSEFQTRLIPLSKLSVRFTAWLGAIDVEGVLARSEVARGLEYALRKAKISSEHLMSPAEEALASDLGITGASAWSKLHGNVTSQLAVTVNLDGGAKSMPMSAVRNLAYEADRTMRRAGYEAELAAWKATEVPLAAAMNSIKGEVNTLAKRRGWGSSLDEAIFNANIDRQTLDAMMQAAHESFPDFRRYLSAKARMLGLERLAWFDIFAPVGGSDRNWSIEGACDFVSRHFGGYSDKMGAFADRTFAEAWTDFDPKPGKRDGAFCMSVRGDESRVLMNFKPSFGSVSTLAHELGHAYHNLCLADRTPLQKSTPMTLAETASIFCETIVKQAALQEGTPEEQLSILEASLQGACQVVVDITSRFLFEKDVFERRDARELSAKELCDSMIRAQQATYGDGLDPDLLHPYMWAVKPHYYGGRSFYNFPYMFGLLFGLGLYAIYREDPDGFRARYDDLLSSTGLADAATLAQRFGIDIRTPDFWRGSLNQIKSDIDRFESLA